MAVQGVPMGGYNGNNYSGYYSSQVNNGNIPYEQVAGNWTVPTVPSDGSINEVGSWVGIGGILSGGKDELQQAGVISIASSPPSYRFFWENYSSDGSSPVLQGPTVTGGDTVYVDVYDDPSTSDTTYFMENLTTDQYYSTPAEYTSNWSGNSNASSADFEFEMPVGDTSLPSYPTVPFYGCDEYQGSTLTTVTAANSTETTITADGSSAYPSALGTETNGFQEIFGNS